MISVKYWNLDAKSFLTRMLDDSPNSSSFDNVDDEYEFDPTIKLENGLYDLYRQVIYTEHSKLIDNLLIETTYHIDMDQYQWDLFSTSGLLQAVVDMIDIDKYASDCETWNNDSLGWPTHTIRRE